MPSIEITRVGTSDLAALKRNFTKVLYEQFNSEPARPQTFLELIAKRGQTDKQVQTSARRRANYALQPRPEPRSYPTIHEVQHRLTIEAQGPLVTYDGDGGFSSRGLTDWYVALYCDRNHLKH